MGSTFTPITAIEIRNLLDNGKGWHETRIPGTHEMVWDFEYSAFPGLCLRLYTSIVGEHSRDCGEDALRLVIIDTATNRPIIKAPRRINRTNGWDVRLKQLAAEMSRELFVKKPTACPLCNKWMREITGKNGPFLGCVGYPTCRGTRKIAAPSVTKARAEAEISCIEGSHR